MKVILHFYNEIKLYFIKMQSYNETTDFFKILTIWILHNTWPYHDKTWLYDIILKWFIILIFLCSFDAVFESDSHETTHFIE